MHFHFGPLISRGRGGVDVGDKALDGDGGNGRAVEESHLALGIHLGARGQMRLGKVAMFHDAAASVVGGGVVMVVVVGIEDVIGVELVGQSRVGGVVPVASHTDRARWTLGRARVKGVRVRDDGLGVRVVNGGGVMTAIAAVTGMNGRGLLVGRLGC
jgi:hypothetical protein